MILSNGLKGMKFMAKTKPEISFCVKVQQWENGLLKKTIGKDFFKKESEAERFYNECEQEGTRVQLSIYVDGNERSIKEKRL